MLQPRLRPLVAGVASLPSLCQRALQLNTIRRYAAVVPGDVKNTPGEDGSAGFGPPSTQIEAVKMRTYKPRTPGLRHLKRPINDHLWKGRPYLPLTIPKKREQATGNKTYIVAAEGMRAGDVVQSYRAGIPQDLLDSMGGVIDPGILAAKTAWRGNCLPMHMIPVGTVVYNVGSRMDGGAVFCRSAGTYATIISKEEETRDDGTKVMTGKHVVVRLQSGEIRKVSKDACATIGVASNIMHQYRQLGKAGRSRLLNIRPTVRGLAMNATGSGLMSNPLLECSPTQRQSRDICGLDWGHAVALALRIVFKPSPSQPQPARRLVRIPDIATPCGVQGSRRASAEAPQLTGAYQFGGKPRGQGSAVREFSALTNGVRWTRQERSDQN
ncbi:hypothetical protein CHGG_02751 [Chaetomium globosum CBS 148.51]|uniref:Large ribosomal subunit protein uL2 C-terminal domain-containing protein n=1 Tax=Chaetomium globosum (strain ATCC 6205 / CBS 148.51 / DSM 1962 / NBRC 6347 / NRRL 1970) TaxID=306901 RepID=Q2HAK3_CHAGB|nr:uncharacterized protein CHGG_02751 [Chaetomium globosum CBS 148.51]EAQ90816.1 hypothetical protein CHGG_02751 [Chaetomium globosum CBS 148.51]